MQKLLAKIAGAVLLAAGVGAVVVHYTLEGHITASWVSLVVAVVLLLAGWTLFDWGAGVSRRWGAGNK
jgi:hypothetical protein